MFWRGAVPRRSFSVLSFGWLVASSLCANCRAGPCSGGAQWYFPDRNYKFGGDKAPGGKGGAPPARHEEGRGADLGRTSQAGAHSAAGSCLPKALAPVATGWTALVKFGLCLACDAAYQVLERRTRDMRGSGRFVPMEAGNPEWVFEKGIAAHIPLANLCPELRFVFFLRPGR